jgi:RNA polymerase sigma-54 factor
MTQLTERDRSLVRFLIEALDDDGYLSAPCRNCGKPCRRNTKSKSKSWKSPCAISRTSIRPASARAICRNAWPATAALPDERPQCRPDHRRKHLELLAARDFAKLRRVTGYDDEDLKAAQGLITSLNPRPAAGYAQVEARYITPDVIVKKLKGKWTAYINPDAYPACASTACMPKSCQAAARQWQPVDADAGSPLADQERPAALRHHPCHASDC